MYSIFKTSWKCSQMISRIYRILLGEEDLPTSERSVFYKNKSYTDKVYNKAIDDMIKDKNEINEKNVVGFISFIVMVLFAIADLVTSFIFVGEEAYLVINEVIYNSFVWVTLGCFGISSFEKVKGK